MRLSDKYTREFAMDNFDAYAPPRAVVSDAEIEKPQIPLAFKILLIAYIVLHLVGSLLGVSSYGIVWGGVMVIASWKTLGGSRPASRVLGVLLSISAILMLVGAAILVSLGRPGSAVTIAFFLGLAAWVAVLVGFIYFHPAMQAVFRKSDAKKWSGG
jgi:hypothetical protein